MGWLAEQLAEWIQWAWNWIASVIGGMAESGMELIFESLPAGVEADLAPYGTYLQIMNTWLPMEEFFVLMPTIWLFQSIFAGIKIAIKVFIPTVG